ncbi:MAG: protein kinase [Ignavibacteriaceae bacterium]
MSAIKVDNMQLKPGFILENFKIISMLGEGGMGIVYKALDIKLERYVALKVLNPQAYLNPQFSERFKREAKNQAKLNHPNLVAVYGFTDQHKLLGIVMEYVEGETLEKCIERRGRLDYTEAMTILEHILVGVGYAHSKGFIHRDIKPSNVIISREGIVKIMDFGISKSVFEKSITKTGTKIGTLLYMSPEQLKAEEPSRQSDIYSIGATFYEMIAGKPPFDFSTEYEIMEGHIKKNPPKLAGYITNVPPDIDRIISKALEKSVYKRYKNCEEFLNDIQIMIKWSESRPISKGTNAIKPTKPTKPTKSARRKSNLKFYFIAALIIAIFGFLFYFSFGLVRDFWTEMKSNKKGKEDSTFVSYQTSPFYKSLANFKVVSTGMNQNLSSVYFIDDLTGYACGEGGTVIRTFDGGDSWSKVPQGDLYNFNNLYFFNDREGIIIGDNGNLYLTQDSASTLNRISVPVGERLLKIYFFDEYNGFVTGANGVILKTSDRGNSWDLSSTQSNEHILNIYFPVRDIGYAVGKSGIVLKSNDSGKSWRPLKRFSNKYLKCLYFIDPQVGFVAGAGGEVFKTENGGETWKKAETGMFSGILGIRFSDSNNGFAVSTKGEFIFTSDGGDSWSTAQSGQFVNLTDMSVSPSDEVYFSGLNGTILKQNKKID